MLQPIIWHLLQLESLFSLRASCLAARSLIRHTRIRLQSSTNRYESRAICCHFFSHCAVMNSDIPPPPCFPFSRVAI